MQVFDLFSKRQKKIRGETPDVYVYDDLPEPLKVQIVHIWLKTLGNEQQILYVRNAYEPIVGTLRHEYGVFQLPGSVLPPQNACQEFVNFFLQENDFEKALDAIELSFSLIDGLAREGQYFTEMTLLKNPMMQ